MSADNRSEERTQVTVVRHFLVNVVGLDRAIAWSLLDNAWKVLKAPLTIYFIVTYLTPREQGLWYSFGSLAALTMFAELGFTYIITQFVSHEFAHLRLRNGFVVGKKEYRDRIFSLIRYSLRFYLMVLPLAVVILGLTGTLVYRAYEFTVLVAWYVFTVVSALNLYSSLIQSIYQGLNQVVLIKKNVFVGSIVNTLVTWAMLMAHAGLWALVIGNFAASFIVLIVLYRETIPFWRQLISHQISAVHSWFHEIITLQWRYAVTWIAGYFIFYFMVPTTLNYLGAVPAGQLGISLAIFSSLGGMVGAWGQTKVPRFNILVAQQKRDELNALLAAIQRQTFIINILGNIVLLAVIIYGFPYLGWDKRILPLDHLVILALISIPNMLVFNWAYYLRAHKIEPYMTLTVLNGAALGIVVWVSLKYFLSIKAALVGYCIIQWAFLIPAGIVFYRIRGRYAAISLSSPNQMEVLP